MWFAKMIKCILISSFANEHSVLTETQVQTSYHKPRINILIQNIIQLHTFFQYERQKKLEREHKKKQEAQSLEETKEQITQLEKNLTNFKKDKHELFHTLKKVLFEDDTRRRSKEAPHPPQPQLYMQSAIRPPHGSVYMKPNPQLLISKYNYNISIFAYPIAQRTT